MKQDSSLHDIIAILAGVLVGIVFMAVLLLSLFGGVTGFKAAAKFAAVMRVIQTDYVAEYDVDDLTDAALTAMVDGLDDDWSYYMNAETYAYYLDYSANQYQGIGVTIEKDEETGGFLIAAITKDGPAEAAGLLVGDVILAVDGVAVTGAETTELRALIQADYGGSTMVTVLRESGETADISVSCEVIYSSPVSARLLDGSIGYIVVSNFRQGAGAEAIAAVEDMIAQGAQSLLFDVRSNPGGQVTELVELLDYLLPEGDIFIRADKTGRENIETSDAACVEMPMAVLVNADSYSAAEFFAAALREYDWATVVGEHTTGKARSQVTIPLSDGSAVHISEFTYLTPQRNDLYEAGGLAPDVEVLLTDEEQTQYDTGWLLPAEDPQIQAAAALFA